MVWRPGVRIQTIIAMRPLCAALLVLAIGAGTAHAEPERFYLGADLVRLTTRVEDRSGVPPDVTGKANVSTLRLKFGGGIFDWLDVESHLVVPQDEAYSHSFVANTVQTGGLALFLKPRLVVGRASLYGLLGFPEAWIDLGGSKVGHSGQYTSSLSYGLGAQWRFTRNLSATIDYTHYYRERIEVDGGGSLDVDLSAIAFGLAYSF